MDAKEAHIPDIHLILHYLFKLKFRIIIKKPRSDTAKRGLFLEFNYEKIRWLKNYF